MRDLIRTSPEFSAKASYPISTTLLITGGS